MKKAQSLVEYSLILVLISLIAVSTLHFLGKHMSLSTNKYKPVDAKQNITETMNNYCEQKGMIYNAETENCNGIPTPQEEISENK